MKIATIAFFCFNRADKTKEVLNALSKNELAADSEIFIFCDGPRNVRDFDKIKEVYEVIEAPWGFKKINIIKREINHGVRFSIVSGINQVLESHDSLIVVEDDIITDKNFLKFLNESLNFYQNQQNVWCVTGFNFPKNLIKFPSQYREDIFFVKGKTCPWGWATWKNRWQKIDFEIQDFDQFIKDKKLVKEFNRSGGNMAELLRFQKEGKVQTWDIQMSYAMFKNGGYCVHPVKTLVKNIGFDDSGTHTKSDLNLTNFEFENFSDWTIKTLEKIPNNNLAEASYINFHKDDIVFVKWFKSPKRRRNFKWMLVGIVFCELIHFFSRACL